MKDPLKGVVVWGIPENKEVSVTLFKDPRTQELEDKDWTFVVEDVSIRFKNFCAGKLCVWNSADY